MKIIQEEFIMKKFISVSPFQPPLKLGAGIYMAVDNDKLAYEKETSFPIIPVINAYAEKGEEITIVTVVSDYENTKANYETLKKAIDELADKKGFKVDYREIKIPYDNSLEVQLNVFSQLMDNISDGDKLFCDITYGTKVTNQILTMGVNYGYRVCKDVIPGCIVYGEKDFNTNQMKIYDITSLIFLDEIVRISAESRISNPTNMIKKFMNWGENDA